MRMNAVEYVHDVCGENEREAVNSEEDRSPTVSGSPMSPSRRRTREPLPAASVGGQDARIEEQDSPNFVAQDSEESRVYPIEDPCSPWDDIECGQPPGSGFFDLWDIDLNQ